ncbi:hypothetical protein HOLleu_12628 [Holothuria leucospilota]|uniref:TERF1-interacting nuclear factor 2 N-terminal domain-containing protein n=1 Tax=Holothuria leucospilota TaxID=206669 RepID=A0A9Q1HD33_HOLLE|nr:hypothetical protein HOLleu_12628 [Holothuria leucospilota]
MDLDQELAEEALEYACFLDCVPVVFWLLYKYFNTDQLVSHLSASCKKRVTCQLLYWIVKDSKVALFSRCLTILRLLKEDHSDVCSQKDWAKLELGIKLKIVLQQMLNGSSQSQCLEIFYEQFPDFEKDKTESSNSEEHMLQLLFQLIQQPSVAARNDNFQNEVGSKLIHTIRHRVKHLVVNLNKKLPQPQLEKARLDMKCTSGKQVKDFEEFSEKKKKFCEFLQKSAKPTSQQLLLFLEGNNQNELDYDQKVEIVERIWHSIPESVAKQNKGKRIPLNNIMGENRNSKKRPLNSQTFVDTAKETKLAGSSSSHTKSGERMILRHKPDTIIPSVTRLRSSSLVSKRGSGDVINAPGKRILTSPDCTHHEEKGSDTNIFENWPLRLHELHTEKNTDFLGLYHEESDLLRRQIDDAEKLINECINSNSVVKLKRFKSPESLSLYGKQEDRHSSTFMRNGYLAPEDFSQNHEPCYEKEIFPEIIILSDSDDSSGRVSSRLRQRKSKRVDEQDDSVNAHQDVRETESLNSHRDSSLNSHQVGRRLRESKRRHVDRHDDPMNARKGNMVAERVSSHSGSSLNSSHKNPVPLSISENLHQSKQSLGEDFTDCRENIQSKPYICRRGGFHSGSDFEMQKTKPKGENDVGRSHARRGIYRKRKSDEKFSEEIDDRVLTSDSDGKESSEEVMIIVGSNCSQSFHHKYGKEKESFKEWRDDGCKSRLIHPRRKSRRLGSHRVDGEMVVKDPASSSLEKDIEEDEKAKTNSRLSAHWLKQSLMSPDLGSMESASTSRDFQRESSENIDVYERSSLSTDKGSIMSPGKVDKQMVNASPVFEYKHSSGSSSDKSISLLTGRRILFTADDELIPHVSIEVIPEVSQENFSGYPIDLSDLASFPDGKKNCTTGESDQQVRLTNSSNSHISSRSEVNSDQVRVISETPPESPDGNVNNVSPLAVSPSGNNLTMQKSAEYHSDSSSLQYAQRQQTHSFSKSSSDDIQHVSDSEDEEDSPAGQNSQNHPRFPSLVQYLKVEVVESPIRACSVVLQKIKLDKLRLRVLLSQDSQERS